MVVGAVDVRAAVVVYACACDLWLEEAGGATWSRCACAAASASPASPPSRPRRACRASRRGHQPRSAGSARGSRPKRLRPRRSGRLKVAKPSPTPHRLLIAANRAARRRPARPAGRRRSPSPTARWGRRTRRSSRPIPWSVTGCDRPSRPDRRPPDQTTFCPMSPGPNCVPSERSQGTAVLPSAFSVHGLRLVVVVSELERVRLGRRLRRHALPSQNRVGVRPVGLVHTRVVEHPELHGGHQRAPWRR